MSRTLNVRLHKALILPIAIYRSKTWTLREQDTRALLVFEMKCLRAILGVTRLDRLSNARIRQTLGIRQIIEGVVSERRLRWFGHVARNSEMINDSYKQDFPKASKRGRLLKMWTDAIRQQSGLPLLTLERRSMRRKSLLVFL